MIAFTRGLSLFFSVFLWENHVSLNILLIPLTVSGFRSLVSCFQSHFFQPWKSTSRSNTSDTFMAAWYEENTLLHFPLFKQYISSFTKDFFFCARQILIQKIVFFTCKTSRVACVFRAQSTSLWPLVRFHGGFCGLHYCFGATDFTWVWLTSFPAVILWIFELGVVASYRCSRCSQQLVVLWLQSRHLFVKII